ncbi:endospore germination permease [Paenibacillus sp. GCM10023248]|uniref:GerAB/ArcD/ProY family transporter n=1 Tax=Bacillales TaxID=1385 RepID=UPI0023780ED3|nr:MULTISPECIES: endospore germination permease [Bacillales]MDD9268721.1 endospore germination permease [Paenibacillus sp. MAHUQ-63]MDR6880046.1 spore germination protein [Bacillus sp. 3255]
MKSFEYGDKEISVLDIAITVSSMIIGVGILMLPRELANTVHGSDGWISMLAAGLLAISVGWALAKIATHFSKQGYYAYASAAVTKPIAFIAVLGLSLYFLSFCAYEARAIANIAKQYLFETTPVEVIAFGFLMVNVYAVSGSRVGLIRLNILFIPIVLFVTIIVLLFSLSMVDAKELKPYITTDWKSLASAMKTTAFSLLGFEVVLFYITMMNKPKGAPKAVVIGISLPIILYTAIYLVCVGVFTQMALPEITYPAVELAKEMQVPGEFFERFESIFFTIWIMAVFTTTVMAYDCAIYGLKSLFAKPKHQTWVFMLSPIIYLLCMYPKNLSDFGRISTFISYTGFVISILTPISIHLVAKLRGVKSDAA